MSVGETSAYSPRCAEVMVRSGSCTECTRASPWWVVGTTNGSAAPMT